MSEYPNFAALLRLCVLPCFLLVFSFLPAEPTLLAQNQAQGPTLTLAFVGDVMLGRGVAQALDGDWAAAFAGVQPWLVEADLAFANLESPLTTAPQLGSRYDLRASPESVAALRAAGFDAVSLANNHALDAGEVGLAQTRAALDAAGISGMANWVGGEFADGVLPPMDRSANAPVYRFLAFDDSTLPLDVEAASDAVATAAEQADVVVVSVHWGGEYQAATGPRQRAVAKALVGAGATLIVGHGPHVPQRVEWIGTSLVAYSLGNFLFDQPYPVDCRWGTILRVTLQGSRIVAVEAIPTVVERGRVKLADPDDAADIYARLGLEPTSNTQENKP